MDQEKVVSLLTEGFWGGVIASLLATAILAVLGLIFRNSLLSVRRSFRRGKQESDAFDRALKSSSHYAPFAFGVAQGRGLRLLVVAIVIAYIGDIFGSFLYPLHNLFYVVSLGYLFSSLKWFYRIEARALEIISDEVLCEDLGEAEIAKAGETQRTEISR